MENKNFYFYIWRNLYDRIYLSIVWEFYEKYSFTKILIVSFFI